MTLNKIIEMEQSTARRYLDKTDKVERIYINFCNPWPKPRHKKRRLTCLYGISKISYKNS